MKSIEIQHSSVNALAQVMKIFETQQTPGWADEELAAMMAHQLSAPLAVELSRLQGIKEDQVQDLVGSDLDRPQTFGDLLTRPDPPVAVLTMVKEYAKAGMDDRTCPLPRPIASSLYYAAIVVAQLRCNTSLTQLDRSELCRGLRWTLDQPWLGDPLRGLLDQGLAWFDSH